MAGRSAKTSSSWQQLELALNLGVEEGWIDPEEVNLTGLVQQFDQMLAALPEGELLNYGGTYLDKLTLLYHAKAIALLDDWEEEYNAEGSRFDESLLAGLIREHQTVDVSDFVKPISRFRLPQPTGAIDDEDSVFLELDIEAAVQLAEQDLECQTAIDLSHTEDIKAWGAVVQQYFQRFEQNSEAVRLVDLHQSLSLSWVELLLALLLGSYPLEQRGQFYQLDTIWITPQT